MLKPYEEYIPVESKWIDSIPSTWDYKRVKELFIERKERNNPIKTHEILALTAKQGVIPYSQKRNGGGNKAKEDLTQYNIAHPNDLLINCMNVVAGSAGVSKYYGAISPVYYALSQRDDSINIWYYHRIFRLMPFQRSLLGLGKGILMRESSSGALNTVRMRIPMSNLNNVMLPVPPREEQDQIVRFLDWKLAKINKLIWAKKKQIELLTEQKQAVINKAVTKGLDDNVPMKDSSIYWLDKVPSTWRETKLKHILTKLNRTFHQGADLLICSNSGEVIARGESKLGLIATSEDIYQGVKAGDLLIHGMDTWHGAIGISKCDGKCTPVVHVCSSSESKRFIAYYLKMMAYTRVFKAISNGVRQNTSDFRSWSKVGELMIALPSFEEQEKIADYVDNYIEKISTMIDVLTEKIHLLNEYRTRLISDVVTGKVDVRGIEIPEYEAVPDDVTEDELDGENAMDDEAEEAEVE